MHSMRDLIVHALLQAVIDAEKLGTARIGRRGRKTTQARPREWKYKAAYEKRKNQMKTWTDSMRFEFWTEWADIPVDKAEEVILKIAAGEIQPEKLYRADKK